MESRVQEGLDCSVGSAKSNGRKASFRKLFKKRGVALAEMLHKVSLRVFGKRSAKLQRANV